MGSVQRLRYPQNTFMQVPPAVDPYALEPFAPVQHTTDRGRSPDLLVQRATEPRPTTLSIDADSALAQDMEAYLMSCYVQQSSTDSGLSVGMPDDWQDLYNQMGLHNAT